MQEVAKISLGLIYFLLFIHLLIFYWINCLIFLDFGPWKRSYTCVYLCIYIYLHVMIHSINCFSLYNLNNFRDLNISKIFTTLIRIQMLMQNIVGPSFSDQFQLSKIIHELINSIHPDWQRTALNWHVTLILKWLSQFLFWCSRVGVSALVQAIITISAHLHVQLISLLESCFNCSKIYQPSNGNDTIFPGTFFWLLFPNAIIRACSYSKKTQET